MYVVLLIFILCIWYSSSASTSTLSVDHPSVWDLRFLDRYRNYNNKVCNEIQREIRCIDLNNPDPITSINLSKRTIMNYFQALIHSIPPHWRQQYYQDIGQLEHYLNRLIDYVHYKHLHGRSSKDIDIHSSFHYKNHPFPAEQLVTAENNYSFYL